MGGVGVDLVSLFLFWLVFPLSSLWTALISSNCFTSSALPRRLSLVLINLIFYRITAWWFHFQLESLPSIIPQRLLLCRWTFRAKSCRFVFLLLSMFLPKIFADDENKKERHKLDWWALMKCDIPLSCGWIEDEFQEEFRGKDTLRQHNLSLAC